MMSPSSAFCGSIKSIENRFPFLPAREIDEASACTADLPALCSYSLPSAFDQPTFTKYSWSRTNFGYPTERLFADLRLVRGGLSGRDCWTEFSIIGSASLIR